MGHPGRRQTPLEAFFRDCIRAVAVFLAVVAMLVAADGVLVAADAWLLHATPPASQQQVSRPSAS